MRIDIDENHHIAIDENGDKFWYYKPVDTKLAWQWHRTDGPAIEHINGDKLWYIYGKLHREDGPAVEFSEGDGKKPWWCLNDIQYKLEEWIKLVPFKSEEEKIMFYLKWK